QTPTNNSNNSSSKYIEQSPHPTTMYHPSYYPPIFPVPGPYYMSYPPATGHMVPPYPNQYGTLGASAN
ncbi:unnamed protein product, partial [Rotaria socialis]